MQKKDFIQFSIKKNTSLKTMSTFGIGGRSEYFCSVDSPDKFVAVYEWGKRNNLKLNIFSGGSNVVFPDEKLRGLTLRFFGGRMFFKDKICLSDAGVLLGEVIKKSLSRGLMGLETLSGIPGTLGGAVVGNAGAYGRSISEIVKRVEIWDGKKKQWISRKECRFSYRDSVFKHKPVLVLRVELEFKSGHSAELRKISRSIIKIREKKYKPGLKCPGSFFKNVLICDLSKDSMSKIDKSKIIEGKVPAGYLLESVGSKGMVFKGLKVADFHGNLIINSGKAKSSDVKKLADLLRKKVYKKFGIVLEEEVRYLL